MQVMMLVTPSSVAGSGQLAPELQLLLMCARLRAASSLEDSIGRLLETALRENGDGSVASIGVLCLQRSDVVQHLFADRLHGQIGGYGGCGGGAGLGPGGHRCSGEKQAPRQRDASKVLTSIRGAARANRALRRECSLRCVTTQRAARTQGASALNLVHQMQGARISLHFAARAVLRDQPGPCAAADRVS